MAAAPATAPDASSSFLELFMTTTRAQGKGATSVELLPGLTAFAQVATAEKKKKAKVQNLMKHKKGAHSVDHSKPKDLPPMPAQPQQAGAAARADEKDKQDSFPKRPFDWAAKRFSSRKQFRIEQKYDLKMQLGSGASATVFLCVEKETKKEFAVKVISKKNNVMDDENFQNEIQVSLSINHPNVITLHDIFETPDTLYLVMELAYGGDLFDRLLAEKRFPEKAVRNMSKKLVEAVGYLHSHGIVHRDLKPENILFATRDADSELKITDFGFSKLIASKPQLMRANTALGTLGYAAPEVFTGQPYDERADVWSLGVIIYMLMAGVPPFVHIDPEEWTPNIPFWRYVNQIKPRLDVPLLFPDMFWKDISEEAKEFVTACLQVDPQRRPRARELLKHSWLKNASSKHMTLRRIAPSSEAAAAQAAKAREEARLKHNTWAGE